tara:strand:+ start:1285 stop:1617 length:333 start_codon:yes stop_codon:yes gene_type:complete
MGLTGRSARKKAKRQAKRDKAFAEFQRGLTQKFRERFMSQQHRRREFMYGGVVARYRTDQQNAERAEFDVKSRQMAADRLAEQMLTESRQSYSPRKQSLGMLQVPRRRMS